MARQARQDEQLLPKGGVCWNCLRLSPLTVPAFDHPVRVRYVSRGLTGLRWFCDVHAHLAEEFVASVRNDPSGKVLEVDGLADVATRLRLVRS